MLPLQPTIAQVYHESDRYAHRNYGNVQNNKKQKRRKFFGRLPEYVTFIPIDFDTQLKSVIERRSDISDAKQMMDAVAKTVPWIFALEPAGIQAQLQPFQLGLKANVGNAD